MVELKGNCPGCFAPGNGLFALIGDAASILPVGAAFLPRLGGRVEAWQEDLEETVMRFGKALFARLGLLPRAGFGPDAFDLRLQRIGVRERQCHVRAGVFRKLRLPLAV